MSRAVEVTKTSDAMLLDKLSAFFDSGNRKALLAQVDLNDHSIDCYAELTNIQG